MSYRVLITDPVSEEGLSLLKEGREIEVDVQLKVPPEELPGIIVGADALIIRSGTKVTSDVIEAADRLKVIGRAGVGIDNVDIEAATQHGIVVMNLPGGNSIAAAEHTMALMLAVSRNIAYADASIKAGKWERSSLVGRELKGKCLGIVGYGRIGREVAARAKAFDMKILVHDPFVTPEIISESGAEPRTLEELLPDVDYLTLHIPINDETRNIIDADAFDMMKDGVYIINCARGGLISEEELASRLESGKVAGAALDVFEKEPPADSSLIGMNNVLLTPHLGASTIEAKKGVSMGICAQVRDYLLEDKARNAVNLPLGDPEKFTKLEPFMNLSEKIGILLCQIVPDAVSQIKVTCEGDLEDVKLMALSVLKGFLASSTDGTVNAVNASWLARQRGITVIERYTRGEGGYGNRISAVVSGKGDSRIVAGTLFASKHPRIVQVDDYYMEVLPEGVVLMLTNRDVPGIIGQVGTVLGKAGVNIGEFRLGRKKKGDVALAMVNLDTEASTDVMEKLRSIEGILEVEQVRF